MTLFLQDLSAASPFLLRSIAAMALAAVACGIVGCYVVLKRDSYAVGAISHSLLGGIGAALFARATWGWQWLTPWMGALAAAVIVALLITLFTRVWKMRSDTVLSAVWALGMAVGISFITALPGYPPDLNSFLFGSILIIAPSDLWLMGGLLAVIVAAKLLWHQRFVALAFHPELLELRGLSATAVHFAMELLVAMTVVILSQLVGIVLCMALLILPVAAAATFCRKIPGIMTVAAAICFLSAFAGVALSYDRLPGGLLLSPGATVVELTGAAYLLAATVKFFRKRLVRNP